MTGSLVARTGRGVITARLLPGFRFCYLLAGLSKWLDDLDSQIPSCLFSAELSLSSDPRSTSLAALLPLVVVGETSYSISKVRRFKNLPFKIWQV